MIIGHEQNAYSSDASSSLAASDVQVAAERKGWFGDGTGMNAYHAFLLLKTDEGCHIVTEEVVKGFGAVEFRKKQPNAMHEGHNLWQSTLKQRSEN